MKYIKKLRLNENNQDTLEFIDHMIQDIDDNWEIVKSSEKSISFDGYLNLKVNFNESISKSTYRNIQQIKKSSDMLSEISNTLQKINKLSNEVDFELTINRLILRFKLGTRIREFLLRAWVSDDSIIRLFGDGFNIDIFTQNSQFYVTLNDDLSLDFRCKIRRVIGSKHDFDYYWVFILEEFEKAGFQFTHKSNVTGVGEILNFKHPNVFED
jgi:hypothetical protein